MNSSSTFLQQIFILIPPQTDSLTGYSHPRPQHPTAEWAHLPMLPHSTPFSSLEKRLEKNEQGRKSWKQEMKRADPKVKLASGIILDVSFFF